MRGLEPVLEQELRSPRIGGPDLATEVASSGVAFSAPQEVAMKAALWLRTATRLFEEVSQTNISNPDSLYDWCRYRINWPNLMRADQTFKVDAAVHQVSSVNNSMSAG